MLDRLRDALQSSRVRRIKANKQEKESAQKESGGKIYQTWLLVLPLLVGLAAGRLAGVGLGYGLDFLAGNSGVVDSAVTGSQAQDSNLSNQDRGFTAFISSNPFHISPLKVVSNEPAPVSKEVTPPEPPTTLDDVILRGTFPGISAWVEKNGNLNLILIGKEIERWKLSSVSYREATFTQGKKRVTKKMIFGPVKTEAPKPAPAPKRNTPEPAKLGNIVAAEPGKQDGEVSSELVSQLVQNPFDELKRIRIRPNESAGGLEVQWIQNESILKRLGVQKGDIIKSVNGIPFTNMGDIANSINSLMNSERFDVEVTRKGQPTALRYVVK